MPDCLVLALFHALAVNGHMANDLGLLSVLLGRGGCFMDSTSDSIIIIIEWT